MPTAFKNWQKFNAELSPLRRDRGFQDRQQMEDIQGKCDRVFEEEIETAILDTQKYPGWLNDFFRLVQDLFN